MTLLPAQFFILVISQNLLAINVRAMLSPAFIELSLLVEERQR